MGHVARALEIAGIATVIIAVKALRPRLDPMGVPRMVITPYPMGRPIGAPLDAAMQRHTLITALDLLANAPGPEAVIELSGPYRA